MGGLVFIVLVAAVMGFVSWSRADERKKRIARWTRAADRLHLTLHPPKSDHPLRISGVYADLEINIAYTARANNSRARTEFTVAGKSPLPIFVESRPYELLFPSASELVVGHGALDRRFRVEGSNAMILAALPSRVREQLLALETVAVHRGVLRHIGAGDFSSAALVQTVEQLTRVFEDMNVSEESVAEGLLDAFEEETELEVAERQLEAFFAREVDPALSARAVALALEENAPELRLIGAMHGGECGLAVLFELARDVAASDEVRARALTALPASALDFATLLDLRAQANIRLRAAIALRMTNVSDPGVEHALIDALRDEAEEVCIAAARALSVAGTIASVEPLRAAGDGILKTAEIKRAVADAVRAIQERAQGPGRGGLSLVEDEDRGALSISDARGAVSLESKT